jgi:hypothetical protein
MEDQGRWKERNQWRIETGDQRVGSEWEPIKILLKGDGYSKKMNTTNKHVSGSTTQVGQDHVAIVVLLVLGTKTQPSEPKHTNTHNRNMQGLLPVLHLSDLVCAGHTGDTGQTGEKCRSGRWLQKPGNKCSRKPWNKTTSKTQTARKENPTQNLAKLLEIYQELNSSNTWQQGTHQDVHPR